MASIPATDGYNCLAVILESLLKALAGEEDAALHSAEGQTHLLCDLVVLVACYVHRERYAVFVGEGVDGGGDLFCSH